MMIQARGVVALVVCALVSCSSVAMVFDNRFLPLFQRPWIAPDNGRSFVSSTVFAVTTSTAYDRFSQECPLPRIFGEYDLGMLALAMVDLGYPDPFKTEWQGARIPWFVNGKFQGQGVDICWQQQLSRHVAIGASFMAMRLVSWYDFSLKGRSDVDLVLKPNDQAELERARLCIHEKLGLCSDVARQRGIGDIDAYVRFGGHWDYCHKFRTIQSGLRLGILMPTARARDVHYPSWIPLGGDGHWGLYAMIDALFELKEDIKVGCLMRASKRWARTLCRRVPVRCEPTIFGALETPVSINPGATLVAAPHCTFECLRDGLGLRVMYTLVKHFEDAWIVQRPQTAPFHTCSLESTTEWASEYFSLNIFYDISKIRTEARALCPIVSFCWDIPFAMWVSNNSAKTNRVSLGVELSF